MFTPNEAGFSQFERAVSDFERDVAEHIAERMRERVAVDTGATRDSIHVEEVDGQPSVVVGGAATYLEYGTSDTASQPFVFPSLVDTEGELPGIAAAYRG